MDEKKPAQSRPFSATPVAQSYFAADSLEQARRQLVRAIDRAEGVGLVVGPAGIGKSLLLQLVADQFQDRFHVALLTGGSVGSRKTLLQSILFELELPYRGLDEGELRLSLVDHLQPSRECPHGMLLLIDEAHALPYALLEEIRLLTNLVRNNSPRIRLVLAGSARLEERFASPKLESFNQRIATRCYLHGFSSEETSRFIAHEIKRCNVGGNEYFAADAKRSVHSATQGIPRLINQLCDHALMLAAAKRLRVIDAACIQEAWSELQQIPAPWNVTSPLQAHVAANAAAAIEFGALDEVENEYANDELAAIEPVAELVPSADELFGCDFDHEETIVVQSFAAAEIASRSHTIYVPSTTVVPAEAVAEFSKIRSDIRLAELPLVERETPSEPAPTADFAIAASDVKTLAEEAFFAAEEEYDPAIDPVFPEIAVVATAEPVKPSRITMIDQPQTSTPQPHVARTGSGLRFRDLLSTLRGKQ